MQPFLENLAFALGVLIAGGALIFIGFAFRSR